MSTGRIEGLKDIRLTGFMFCIIHQLSASDDVLAGRAVTQLTLLRTPEGVDWTYV